MDHIKQNHYLVGMPCYVRGCQGYRRVEFSEVLDAWKAGKTLSLDCEHEKVLDKVAMQQAVNQVYSSVKLAKEAQNFLQPLKDLLNLTIETAKNSPQHLRAFFVVYLEWTAYSKAEIGAIARPALRRATF